jgi:hypothetical protein
VFTYDWYNGLPADWPLITEVDAAAGFVELTHFGPEPADISSWTLATASTAVTLPPRTVLMPGRPLVVVRSASALRSRFGAVDPVLELPGLVLSEAAGELELRHSGRLVDAVAWGADGWGLDGRKPMCRLNPAKDTDSPLDWTRGLLATPGDAGCGL